jgi:indolepyruvate ferredoxin oxidoreductase alpha subunit
MPEKKLMMGNEAVARGAWEAGVRVSTAYPGTPATEINEYMSTYEDVDTEWSVNEKVSLEVAIGASLMGARVLCSMKQVGVNVAADPLFSLVYTGINGGLVIVTADEPGLHSSQNEQDNRYYAMFAQVPMFEPADAQEARDMVKRAFEVSEQFDTPVFLRMTTRVCHTRTVVECGERTEVPLRPYEKNPAKYTMVPSHAYRRHFDVEKRMTKLIALSDTCEENRIEMRSPDFGVVTSGVCYQYVREALPDYSVLKIGMSYPIPNQLIRTFASQVKYLYVVEENRSYLEKAILVLGIPVEGKEQLLRVGEFNAGILKRRIMHQDSGQKGPAQNVPVRTPGFCKGCGHKFIFEVLAENNITVCGDIGCYGLAALPPYNALDTLICMGASVGMNHGVRKVAPKELKSVGVLGDSTFFHSGMTNLANIVFNKSDATTIILDNRITAMTGHQPNPSTGHNVKGLESPALDIETLCRALGIKHVYRVDGYKKDEIKARVLEEVARPEASVIIVDEKCVMVKKHG